MTEHAIKIKEVYFKAVLSGEKTFEIRKNDRDYQVGDIIHFVPVDDECGMIIPHDPNAYRITYVFHGGEYGLEEGYCVFGILPEEKKMGDLISRSALLKKFDDAGIQITFDLPVEEILGEDVDIDDFAMLVQEAIQVYKKMVIGTIKEMPTAYDVEKVVAD